MILTTDDYAVDEPQGSPHKSQYMTRKDMLWILVIIIVAAIVLSPVYQAFKNTREKAVCATNMSGIYGAMMQYAAINSDRLPPIYHVGENGAPMLSGDGKPYVWASQLKPFASIRTEFFCPAAEDDEMMPAIASDGHERSDIELTYGMYLPMSAKPHLLLRNPVSTVLFAETSNYGSQGSNNPLPFTDIDGNDVKFDAFMIGFNDSNSAFTPQTEWVTRLAVRNASGGYEGPDAKARHKQGIHVIFADGHKGMIQPGEAKVANIFPELEGLWRNR